MTILSDKLLTIHTVPEEINRERSTRPLYLKDYIGQKEVRSQVAVSIEAAHIQNKPLDHILLGGPPGLGKTTLAYIIAREMNVQVKTIAAPMLEKAGDLASLLTHLEPNGVLFIDEIHRLSPAIEEILYQPMEEYQLNILIGEGKKTARSIKLGLSPFTLIGATTRVGMLTSPLRDRFVITLHLNFYTAEDLRSIIEQSAHLLDIPITIDGAQIIAERSRGTPRIANRLLRRVYDYSIVKSHGRVDQATTEQALNFLSIDHKGLNQQDRYFLLTIIKQFGGGPVGLESLAATLGESSNTIEEVIEPFLIQQGLIIRTPRGRIATENSYAHLRLPIPASLSQWRQLTLSEDHQPEST